MKKLAIRWLLILLAASSVTLPRSAQALLLVTDGGAYARGIEQDGIIWLGACVVLFPLCILDGQSGERVAVNQQYLLDNGYTSSEANRIVQELAQISSRLDIHGGREEVSSRLCAMNPAISDETLRAIGDIAGLK